MAKLTNAQKERIKRLESDLSLAKNLVKNNSHWSEDELNAAKFGFCYALAKTDILYQLTCMSGRHGDIVGELSRLITNLRQSI